MAIDNEVVSTWMKLTPVKMLITVLCATIISLGWYVRDEVKSLAQLYVHSVESRVVRDDFSLPTRVSSENQSKIQSVFKSFMRQHNDVGAMFVYEFVPRGTEILYQGRVIVTHVSQSGKDLVQRYNSAWLPMNSDKDEVEKLLRGQVFYRPPVSSGSLTDDNQLTKYNLRLMEQDGYKFMISVPVIDATLQVRGYITTLLTEMPKTDEQIRYYIKNLEFQAVELSQYLI